MDRIFIRDREIATKDYVDSVVAGGGTSTETEEDLVILSNYTKNDTVMAQQIIDTMKSGKRVMVIRKPGNNSANNSDYGPMYVHSLELNITDEYSGIVYLKSHSFVSYGYNSYNPNREIERINYFYQLTITVKNGVVTEASDIYIQYDWNGRNVLPVLSKENKEEYTPTTDYHPATKKYVDDSIAAAGTGGSGDLTNYYTKEQVDAAIAAAIGAALKGEY